ncbi:MAG: tyrosine-protein phosphatase [Lachnospiraceae bacterium]|nr:tyrosine-protein phosphatase [Lachnospiraceae bacterium]
MKVLKYNAEFNDIGKYGEILTSFTTEEFNDAGIYFQDTVKVSFLGKEIIVPFVPSYRCTHSGGTVLVGDKMFKTIPIVAFHSNFVKKHRIAVFLENEDRTIDILPCKGIKFPIEFTFELYEKKGYAEEYKIYDLRRTDNREDYADLSDEDYCNFRPIKIRAMKDNLIFRGSSPINNFMKRAKYADDALKKYGIKTIINLSDSEERAKSFVGFNDTYYSKQKNIYLDTNADVSSYNFGKSVLKAMRFILENEGPYYVHCMEGQDRTGAVCAIFESLLGASKEELIYDFMKTYENFYRVKRGSEQYMKIIRGEMQENIASIRGFTYDTIDILKHPISFLHFLDLTDEEINAFIELTRK